MKSYDLTKVEGYDLIKVQPIKAIDATGYFLRHKKTKARIALLLNDDTNKVFNIAFRTPCSNDTGVPHIMEHSVLCGSKKFPAKDPFVELVQGSLNTFLNAMTGSMKTMYPIASCNDKDYKNLMDVYMDAVFHPNIYKNKEIFLQEGWSYKLDTPEDELTISGVVYNEMKGAFSSPESVLYREIQHEMFPDNEYSYESGGDPDVIPNLTYEEFLEFHKKFYHPSNSFIYMYGNIDPYERLEFLDREYLSEYDYLDVHSELTLQEPFEKVRYAKKTYPIGENEDSKSKAYLTYTTTFGKCNDITVSYAMNILEYALITMPGAPVKKALTEAGICRDLIGGGNQSMQNTFSFIAKGADGENIDKFQNIIEDTLRNLVKNGIDRESLKAALNLYEFKYREADFGGYSKGLIYGLDILETWMFDENNPFASIDADNVFLYLNSVVDTGYFESLIEELILNNPHKSVLALLPERGLTEKKDRQLKEKLRKIKESMTPDEINGVVNQTKALLQYQSEEDSQETLEKIPILKLEDIDKKAQKIYLDEKEIDGVKVVHTNIFSNRIAYVTVSFGTENVPKELIPYVGLLKNIIGEVDTKNGSYIDFNNRINLLTGGMDTDAKVYSSVKVPGQNFLKYEVGIKVFYEKIQYAFGFIKEAILDSVLEDKNRIKEIIGEIKGRLISRINSSGHSVAINRAMSYFAENAYISELVSGVEYFKFIEDLDENFEEKADEILLSLKKVMKKVFHRENLIIGITADSEGYEKIVPYAVEFIESLPKGDYVIMPRDFVLKKKNEGLKTSAQVQYVARTGNFRVAGYDYSGSMKLLENIMDYDYLWKNVRVKGGAYGCMSGYAPTGNVFFCSYRDPHLNNTNDVFEGIPEYLRTFNATDRDILKFIIGTISSVDKPRTAYAQGQAALGAYIKGVTMEDVQKERDEILSVNNEKIRELAEIMEAVLAQGNICVVGNAGKIEEAKDLFIETKELIK